jgi:di/tricarboxylate transporter
MICTAEGSLRFWEDIRACGPQQFAQSKLNGVQWDDPISQLVPYEPHSYMAVTSGGQLFNVYVTMKGGVPVIQHRSISKPLNLFGKVSEWISGGGSASATAPSGTQSNQRVVSVSVGGRIKSGQPSLYGAPREIFIVTRSHLSCWSIGIDRPEKVCGFCLQ